MRPALALLLLLTACTAGGQAVPSPQPSPQPSPRPSASPAPSAPPGLVVAVAHGTVVDLTRVDTDRVATVERTLKAPAEGLVAGDVTLTAGARPEACVLWVLGESADTSGAQIRCYGADDVTGERVDVERPVADVALTPDGTRLAWLGRLVENDTGYRESCIADRTRAVLRGTRCVSSAEYGYVTELSWLDAARLLVQRTTGDNDDPGHPAVVDVVVDEERQVTPEELVLTSRYDLTSALARDGDRGVRFDLSTGKVLQVVATAAEGRRLDGLSGGPAGVVYVTRGRDDVRVYLRLPGESRGVPVEGLPTEVELAVAQPS